jgi:hypothetical protein
MSGTTRVETAPRSEGRRAFLMTAGKVALAAPPVMTAIVAAGSRPAHAGVNYRNTNKVNNNTTKRNTKKFFNKNKNVGVL